MIEISNFTSFAVDKKLFLRVAKKVLKGENRERENLSVAFVSSAEIKKLNRKYRRRNKPTDVLSFGETPESKLNISEVVICPEIVKKNAKEFGVIFEEELVKMLVHGILHVLGYEHEKSKKKALEMERKQEKYLSII